MKRPGSSALRRLSRFWSNRAVRTKFMAATLFPTLALIASVGAFQVASGQQQRADAAVRHSLRVSASTQEVQNALQVVETSGYAEAFSMPALATGPVDRDALNRALARLRALVSDDPSQTALLKGFEDKIDAEIAMSKEFGKIMQTPGGLSSLSQAFVNKATTVSNQPRTTLEQVKAKVSRDLEKLTSAAKQASLVLQIIIMIAALLGVGGAIAISLFSGRSIVRRIREVADNAQRLAAGQPLEPIAANTDEVGVLALELEQTARLLAEREGQLNQAKEEAERANKAKSEFLSRMSHELRTPLNSILGFGQLMTIAELSDDQRENVHHIMKGGRHLLGLINEVLDIARIEAGEFTLSIEPVGLAEIVGETMDLVRPLAAAHRIEITAADAGGRLVLADSQRLKQILLNLVMNAVKYNVDGGAVLVSFGQSDDARLRIRISDTGPGIDPGSLNRLFTPFDRIGAENQGVEGTGLGLALSQKLAVAMAGEITVESVVGGGSTFTLELPAVVAVENPSAGAPHQPHAWDPHGQGPIVLYIEDNLANLTLVERILEQRGEVRLMSAMQGLLGVELARQHQPALILLDNHLPDMSGDEVLRHLQQDPRTADLPVVAVSADATPRRIKELRDNGVKDFVTKPFDVQRFLAAIDAWLPVSVTP